MGAEDMALFLERAPGSFFFLPALFDDESRNFPHHHPKFDLNEEVFWIGPAVMAHYALTRRQ
jgi:amidohydrolase